MSSPSGIPIKEPWNYVTFVDAFNAYAAQMAGHLYNAEDRDPADLEAYYRSTLEPTVALFAQRVFREWQRSAA
ncbi:hypothetical protein HY285_03235 [Candidatus Peregrinibacteria bacterium]|nr:hypothetical protein [Candidatus Peregrinibacteria bacterium]MBI3816530.1 hypothetical protein [Candidatus Peregrinibacteria bacterium]